VVSAPDASRPRQRMPAGVEGVAGLNMPLVIAEVGSVHDGSMGNALKLIDAVADCGAQAVKFQTHIPEAETLRNAPQPGYFDAEPRFEYFQRTGFDESQWRTLRGRAQEAGLYFVSSPFSCEAVDLLERVGVDAYKVPSGEVTNIPMLERIARTGRPCLLSSGMSSWEELDAAVEALHGLEQLFVLQCSSVYPCPPEMVGLNVVDEMRDRYSLETGLSDHTTGLSAPVAAAARGVRVIEKHFTFSRMMYGSDAAHSMEPEEFRTMVGLLHDTWKIIDNPVDKRSAEPYAQMKVVFEKSIVAARPIAAGKLIELEDMAFKKPGGGISPRRYRALVGRKARRDMGLDHVLTLEDLE